MVIPTVHFRSEYSEIPLRIAKGHFATSHSHINYFIDMTYTKHRLAEARQAARELAVGACLAEELIEEGITNDNEHNTLYVVTPETTTGNLQIFRENIAHLIRIRRFLVLAASVTTGGAVQEALGAVRYYGGIPVGICSIFSCLDTCGDFPVTTLFHAKVLGDYRSVPAAQCPLCREGVKLDALVNSYGISSFL